MSLPMLHSYPSPTVRIVRRDLLPWPATRMLVDAGRLYASTDVLTPLNDASEESRLRRVPSALIDAVLELEQDCTSKLIDWWSLLHLQLG